MSSSIQSVDVPFLGTNRMKGHGKTIGVIGLIVVAQLFIVVAILDNSPLLPGNWAVYQYAIMLYIGIFVLALVLLGYTGQLRPLFGIPATGFAIRLALWSAATWIVLTVLFSLGTHSTSLLGSEKLQILILTGVFVAPVEELFFRVAAPLVLPGGWFAWSVLGFAFFHAAAYAVQFGASITQFGPQLVVPGVMGAVLWGVYRLGPKGKPGAWGGLGGSIGVHFCYNVFMLGAIAGLPISLAHLGLVPI